jgi:hypothetical protein
MGDLRLICALSLGYGLYDEAVHAMELWQSTSGMRHTDGADQVFGIL